MKRWPPRCPAIPVPFWRLLCPRPAHCNPSPTLPGSDTSPGFLPHPGAGWVGQQPGSVDWELVPPSLDPWALMPSAAILGWQRSHFPWHSPAIKLQGASPLTTTPHAGAEWEGLSSEDLLTSLSPRIQLCHARESHPCLSETPCPPHDPSLQKGPWPTWETPQQLSGR